MTRTVLIAIIVAGISGCSEDPAKIVLPPGSQAVVVKKIWAAPGDKAGIEPGVRVTVGNDPGDPLDPQHQPRKVQVTIETGERRNESVTLNRSDLRPIK